MKKIKIYILMLAFSFFCVFASNSNLVLADDVVNNDESKSLESYIVINPNSRGEAQYAYETTVKGENGEDTTVTKQYTKSRDVLIGIDLPSDELVNYKETFSVCEKISADNGANERCSSYSKDTKKVSFQIYSKNDGEKELVITFKSSVAGVEDLVVTRKLVLDTIGPVITLKEGEYMFVPLGQTYQEPGATCSDNSGVLLGECKVEYEEADINMNTIEYQYVRYTAKDFLGNETNVVRKILVEIAPPEEEKDYTYWIIAGVGVALLSAFLFLQVWKNKEKQKNQSVL